MLSHEERDLLQQFVDANSPETPYMKRVRILLMADSGSSAELISTELEVQINRVRQWLRAFHRQRFQIFPNYLLGPKPAISVEDPIAVSGKQIMAGLLKRLTDLEPELTSSFSVESVHESRKNIRRLRTALEQLAPYYDYLNLKKFRRRFRKFMRRLGPSRDIAVFVYKLNLQMEEGQLSGQLSKDEYKSLGVLSAYWQEQGRLADDKVRKYLSKNKYQNLLKEFATVLEPDQRDIPSAEQLPASRTGNLVPNIIDERLADVRDQFAEVQDGSVKELHLLRIRLKELRYTLEIYEPILGPTVVPTIESVKTLLLHLGDINDAQVHIELVTEMAEDEMTSEIEIFTEYKRAELKRLIDEFPELWAKLDQTTWRENLSQAVASL